MCSDALVQTESLDTVFQATLNIHQPHGQMCIRRMHADSRHAAAGVSMWLSDQFQSVLNNLSHFVIDSTVFCLRVQRLEDPGSDFRMVRVELKDYFLSSPEVSDPFDNYQ